MRKRQSRARHLGADLNLQQTAMSAVPVPVKVMPSIGTQPATKPGAYSKAMRNLSFLTDLLADKMDAVRQKFDMAMRVSDQKSAELLNKAWHQLHADYRELMTKDRTGKAGVVFSHRDGTSKTDPILTSRIQKSLDLADAAMNAYGSQMQGAFMSLQQKLLACDAEIKSKSEEISRLQSSMNQMGRSMQKERAQCSAQIETLSQSRARVLAEVAELKALKATCDTEIAKVREELSAAQTALENALLAGQEGTALVADLNAQIDALNAKINQLEEPIVLQTSAFTAGGAEPMSISLGDRAQVLQELSDRGTMLTNLRDELSDLRDKSVADATESARQIQKAKEDAAREAQAAKSATMRNLGIAAAVVIAAAGGTYYYMQSRK